MKKQSQRMQELLMTYRKNRCTRSEYEELIELAQIPGNEMVIKEIMRKDWEGQEFDVSNDQQLLPKPNRMAWKIPMQGRAQAGWKVAASIAILVAIGFVLFQWFSSDSTAYFTGNGEVMEITLPDGSEVTLNANSHLTWIPTKNQSIDRLVELTGEAFFKVSKEKVTSSNQTGYRGFQVRTPKVTVHVLGTSFNVTARDENTEVFLQEGSVELLLPDQEEEVRRMVPGDKVTMNNHTGTVTERRSEDITTSASWVTGVLNYHDKSMEEVLQNLSELFGVEISCEDNDLMNKKINLGVPYMDWENTRVALEMAIEVEFKNVGGRYLVVQTNKINN